MEIKDDSQDEVTEPDILEKASEILKEVSDEKFIKIWNWMKDKSQLQVDHTANLLFLELVKQNYEKLTAKGLKVVPVWECIAKKMQGAGYSFAIGKDRVAKLKVKWNNLVASRKQYAKLISATGSGADVLKKKPSYLEEIDK